MHAWRARSRFATCLVALFLVPALLVGCNRAPKVPVEYPFTLQAGHRLHGEFRVADEALHAVQLVYRFNTEAERQRAWWRAGGTALGVDATFAVSIRRRSDGSMVLDETVKRPHLSSWGSRELSSEVVRVRLAPGTYVVDVHVDAAEPSLREQRVDVEVRRAYVGK